MPDTAHCLHSGGQEVFVGRLDGVAGASRLEYPSSIERRSNDVVHGTAPTGEKRVGKPTDVKPGLHWLLVPREGGGYQLRPVKTWYEFDKPVAGTPPTIKGQQPFVALAGEAELRRVATQRKETADRLAAMYERREARVGVTFQGNSAGMQQVMQQLVPDEGEAISMKKKEFVFQPEDERLDDEMGIRKQKKKKAKALQKQVGAAQDLEDKDEVPETANALLALKHERGEAGWDVDDDELFSDDEPEPCDFEGDVAEAQDADMPCGDEDEAEDVEKDLSTAHGRHLEDLIETVDEQFDEHQWRHTEEKDSGAIGGDEISEALFVPESDASHAAKRQKVQAPLGDTPLPPHPPVAAYAGASTSASSTAPPPKLRTPQPTTSETAHIADSVRSAEVPTHRTQAAPIDDPKSKVAPVDDVKSKAISFLRKQNGQCTVKEMYKILNLKELKKQQEEYNRVVEIMKEVAETDVTTKTMQLRPEYKEAPQQSGSERKVASLLQDRFEKVVPRFVAALRSKAFKSLKEASDYLETKKKGDRGLTDAESAEILLRFGEESGLKS